MDKRYRTDEIELLAYESINSPLVLGLEVLVIGSGPGNFALCNSDV